MPRYFIDTDDGDLMIVDDEGHDLPNLTAARRAANKVLPEMAREKIQDDDRRTLYARVRAEDGTDVYTATLSLVGKWNIKPPVD
ncbi:DUF6894 family protein [Methylobacterium trifolii]|uniref:DUF6894 family protein n=1 Tax=Methylobacterium trifolii TaxID=1003092 RepID=UPI001EDFBF54|nr:hypothetical protein [Methylobacterium trifolii]